MKDDPKQRYVIPDDWPFQDARDLFLHPDVRDADHADCDFKWEAPDIEGLVKYLVHEKGFNEDRVRSAGQRLSKTTKVAQQARLEGFFKAVPKTDEEKKDLKRKHDEKIQDAKKKKKESAKDKKDTKSKAHINT